ncbi:2-2-dialkylglycine decarboxylase (pyruvate) [Penicillium maclennaniae]|uniref:2-2-dialkylglycine decarboxylase (pyruvate) n=1 Tax=Penicillium maclennaniae TaxID=1343394 RepID=UPI0025408733|nr:2-2-dialkylglycine decarboxylase (pyruvate) [Penicillium maclennaniae]KAJ5665468.1 2-2-dialkylglycine decarboxylase (pyruvate) [Penicillium maclennaniae]
MRMSSTAAKVLKVIANHAASLDHLFSGTVSPPVIRLGERLSKLLLPGLDKAFFLSMGGESNEAATKMAKARTGKFEIVGLGAS